MSENSAERTALAQSRMIQNLRSKIRCTMRWCLEQLGCGWLSSVGLENLDLQLVSILGNTKNGFFIEAGAFDGVNQSNTYYLEKILGWSGILIEPVEDYANRCRRVRRQSKVYNVALVRRGGPKRVMMKQAGLMSVIVNGVLDARFIDEHTNIASQVQPGLNNPLDTETNAVPLEIILLENDVRHVDFFSLDVEGYELEALLGIDFDRVTFGAILIECRSDNEAAIESLLGSHGYHWSRIWSNRRYTNRLYVPNSERVNDKKHE